MTRRSLAFALAVLFVSAGCVTVTAAHVPERFLVAGWAPDAAGTDSGPQSQAFGTTSVMKVAYRDPATDERGYPGSLTVVSLKTLLTPSESALRDSVQEQVLALAEQQGIRVDQEASRGDRVLANGATALFFVYNGTVTRADGVFTQNARAKIMGEVFQCRGTSSAAVSVALAQTTNVRSLGGVDFAANTDATTWRELAADPRGTVENHRGSGGLLYNVACG